ncbi:hypothetical protein [Paludibaculum fermentans]|uniref:hypothetical protein n=1 Tax=Paludibaculum fermentans TaxID=1473598 RepID=UPI003EB9FC0F
MRTNLLTTNDLVAARGWTRSAIKKFLGEPDETETWHYHGVGSGTRFLYALERVAAAESSPEFIVWRMNKATQREKADARVAAAVKANDQARSERIARITSTYQNWRDALPIACEYMFALNRYAKHKECSSYLRDKIYASKRDLIRVLYENGYLTDCNEHETELAPKECWMCDGVETEHDYPCYRCKGSGVVAPAKKLIFIMFKFAIGGKTYCWHQPRDLVRFTYSTTRSTETFELTHEEKEVSLPLTELSMAMELVQWTLVQAQAECTIAA